jgi:mono/diheme cytochrome c family protein
MRHSLVASALFCLPLLAAPRPALADDPVDGDKAFRSKCGSCHGADGHGKTKQGEKMKIRSLTDPAVRKELTDDKIKETINKGLLKTLPDGTRQEMKPLEGKLKPGELEALVAHVKSLK